MSGLFYVGPDAPSASTELETRVGVDDVLDTGVSRDYVDGKVADQVALRATQVYVDGQDAAYAPVSYYTQQDALLVPNAGKGAASGVASLDSAGKLTASQVPVLGNGIMQGPRGPSTAFAGTTTTTPVKVAEWAIGISGITGQPLVYVNTSVQSAGGHPVLEVRIGNSATQTAYADQTLIARGNGRRYYQDYQMITVFPCTPTLSAGQDGQQVNYSPAINYVVNLWLYDADGANVQTGIGSIASAALFLARTVL